jgi:hypothetical protein
MSLTKQEKNKALVLEAFDTLFNKRDYVAAERYWSPDYIQHSAHIAPGREGLLSIFQLRRSLKQFSRQAGGFRAVPVRKERCCSMLLQANQSRKRGSQLQPKLRKGEK